MVQHKIPSHIVNLGIVGASGKFGSLVVYAASQDTVFSLQTLLNRPSQQHISFLSCQVIIDVSHPQTTKWLLNLLHTYSNPPALVVGTTGLSSQLCDDIYLYAKNAPVILDANFSVGANTLKILSKIASDLLKEDWEISILDIHHKHKRDSPSGTALALEEMVSPGGKVYTFSLRFGEVIGTHRIEFRKNGSQIVTLEHQVFDRNCFALGALQAAKWVLNKQPGVYCMRDVLGVDIR